MCIVYVSKLLVVKYYVRSWNCNVAFVTWRSASGLFLQSIETLESHPLHASSENYDLKVVNNIVWCRQLEAKTNDIVTTAEHLLGELAGFEHFQGEANELKDELRTYQREQVDSWSRQVLAAIDHPSEPLG